MIIMLPQTLKEKEKQKEAEKKKSPTTTITKQQREAHCDPHLSGEKKGSQGGEGRRL